MNPDYMPYYATALTAITGTLVYLSNKTKIDKTVAWSGLALAIDAALTPALTGKSLHEWIGLAPNDKSLEFLIEGAETLISAGTTAFVGARIIYRGMSLKFKK